MQNWALYFPGTEEKTEDTVSFMVDVKKTLNS